MNTKYRSPLLYSGRNGSNKIFDCLRYQLRLSTLDWFPHPLIDAQISKIKVKEKHSVFENSKTNST